MYHASPPPWTQLCIWALSLLHQDRTDPVTPGPCPNTCALVPSRSLPAPIFFFLQFSLAVLAYSICALKKSLIYGSCQTLPNSCFFSSVAFFNHLMCHCLSDILPDKDLLFTTRRVRYLGVLFASAQTGEGKDRTGSVCVDRISPQGFCFRT